jgi:hypothetical protein
MVVTQGEVPWNTVEVVGKLLTTTVPDTTQGVELWITFIVSNAASVELLKLTVSTKTSPSRLMPST